MDNSDEEKKPIMWLGRDIRKVPCFRNTYLYAIEGGIGVGLLTFLFTSKTQLATHLAVASFAVISMSYWFHCRYNYSKQKFELSRIKAALQQQVMYEGTQLEKDLEARLNKPDV